MRPNPILATLSAMAIANVALAQDCPRIPVSAVVVDVKAPPYGARGNGLDDDTEAIQAAVNAAGIGATVYIPAGTYRVQAYRDAHRPFGIRLKSDMTLRMDPAAVLKAVPNGSDNYAILLASGVSNVNIIGGTLAGDAFPGGHIAATADGQWGHGLSIIKGSHGIVVQDVTARDCWGDGFYVSERCGKIWFCRVAADHNRRNGLSATSVDGMTVVESIFQRTTGFKDKEFECGCGLDLEPNAGETVRDVTIARSIFRDNATGGISAGQKRNTYLSNILIDNNTITGNGSNPIAGSKAIWVNGASGVRIHNNTIRDNQGIGILLAEGANHSEVTGNTVTGTHAKASPRKYGAGQGILLYQTEGNLVSGNQLRANEGGDIHDSAPTGANIIAPTR